MQSNRDTSINLCFGSEGGYVNRKSDAGGPTNHGITQTTLSAWRGYAVTIEEVKALTKSEAYEIYASEYWNPIRGNDLPSGLDYAVFDFCVNSGPNRASRILQQVLVDGGADIGVDGNIGAQTVSAAKHYAGGTEALIRAYCAARVAWLKTLGGPKGWKPNGRGWTIRVTGVDPLGKYATKPGVVGNAVAMASQLTQLRPATVVNTPVPPETAAKTSDASKGVTSILSKPEILTGGATALTGLIAAVNGNTIFSYTLAAVMVIGAGVAGYCYIYRVRHAVDV